MSKKGKEKTTGGGFKSHRLVQIGQQKKKIPTEKGKDKKKSLKWEPKKRLSKRGTRQN